MARTPAEEAAASVVRVQETDPSELARSGELGSQYNFAAIVAPAQRLVDLFRQLRAEIFPEIPAPILAQVQQYADAIWNIFQTVRNFNVESGSLATFRQQVVSQLNDQWQGTFGVLSPLIAFGSAKLTDFSTVERQVRATVQAVEDKTSALLSELEQTKVKAGEALAAAQKAAAEQGVSQQAVYFRDEANLHETSATEWQRNTKTLAWALGALALVMLFSHRFEWLSPRDAFESAQLITGKVLIFGVISYMLILSAKNFLSHKHNAIVNRHRQNALMTFTALVNAADDGAAKDIVLTHAASCVFAPQETGYAKSASASEGSLAQATAGLLAKGESKS